MHTPVGLTARYELKTDAAAKFGRSIGPQDL